MKVTCVILLVQVCSFSVFAADLIDPVVKVGINGKNLAFAYGTAAKDEFEHMVYLGSMELEDDRLPYVHFKTIKPSFKEYSLGFPSNHNSSARLEIRHLGKIQQSVDWSHLPGKMHRVFGFVSDKLWVTGGEDGVLYLYNANAEKITSLSGHSGSITSLAFDRGWLVSGDSNGLIHLWDLREMDHIQASISPYLSLAYRNDGKWAVWSPEGVYSASSDAEGLLQGFQGGQGLLDSHSFTLNNPELLARKMKSAKKYYQLLSLAMGSSTSALNPPSVSFLTAPGLSKRRDIEVSTMVCDSGGGIESATLYLRGQAIPIDEASRGVKIHQETTPEQCSTFTRAVSLANGMNDMVIVAKNHFGIESEPAKLIMSYEDTFESAAELHVVTIAVSDYLNDNLDLKYPVTDADTVREVFSRAGFGYFHDVKHTILNNEKVTPVALTRTFDELSQNVKENDVLLVFLAGHGVFADNRSEYYFLPYDVDMTSPETLAETSVSSRALQGLLSDILASQTLVMIDTCQSGGFKGVPVQSSSLSEAQLNAVHRLGRASLMASSQEQVAFEGYKGHGAFTHIVTEGMQGAADYTKDSYVSVDELSTYVSIHLPDLTERRWGYRQEATRNMTGHNFVIGKLDLK